MSNFSDVCRGRGVMLPLFMVCDSSPLGELMSCAKSWSSNFQHESRIIQSTGESSKPTDMRVNNNKRNTRRRKGRGKEEADDNDRAGMLLILLLKRRHEAAPLIRERVLWRPVRIVKVILHLAKRFDRLLRSLKADFGLRNGVWGTQWV